MLSFFKLKIVIFEKNPFKLKISFKFSTKKSVEEKFQVITSAIFNNLRYNVFYFTQTKQQLQNLHLTKLRMK